MKLYHQSAFSCQIINDFAKEISSNGSLQNIEEENHQKTVKSRNRAVMPSVVSSVEYKNYLKTKMDKKAEEEEKKKERITERARKKAEKDIIKLEKAAEREKKKAMTQAKKKQATSKKSKRGVQSSSSEEEDDHKQWEPQDESDENIEENDCLEQDPFNDEQMQLDHSFTFIPPDHENDVMEDTIGSVLLFDAALRGCDIDETQREIVESIEEVIGITSPSLIEKVDEEGVQREEGSANLTEKDGKLFEDLSVGDKEELIRDKEDLTKKVKNLVENPTVGEGDYITAFLSTKRKKTRVACCVLKIADGIIEAKCMTACNRLKTVFTFKEEVMKIEQNNIITQLPKPLVLANKKLLFELPLEID